MPAPLAVVTGATGGIGQVVAKRLWQEGYSLELLCRSPGKLGILAAALEKTLHSPIQQYAGYTKPFPWEGRTQGLQAALGRSHQQGGAISLLVVCHGAAPCVKPTTDLTTGEVEELWRTDVVGTLDVRRLVAPFMQTQQAGAVVIVSSLHARTSYPQRLPYVMAKSALSGLVRSLALEWGPYGIRTNAVLPWQVSGERTERFIAEAAERGEDLRTAYLARSPMGWLIAPEDIADAVLFLARNAACNGVELVLDGGVSASMWYRGYEHG